MTLRRIAAELWTLGTLVACSIPGGWRRLDEVCAEDKLYHFVAFFVYALLWRAVGVRTRTVLATGLAFALFIEVWQLLFIEGRYADPLDLLADVLGLGAGLLLAGWIAARKKKREQR